MEKFNFVPSAFLCVLFALALVPFTSAELNIVSPVPGAYNVSDVQLSISGNETYNNLSYAVDSGSLQLACENCSSYAKTLQLAEGNHSVYVEAHGNASENESVLFSVAFPVNTSASDFSFSIASPVAKVYNSSVLLLDFEPNRTVDYIRYKLDNGSWVNACSNCSGYEANHTFADGLHSVLAEAGLGSAVRQDDVSFAVVQVQNATGNTTGNGTTNTSVQPQFSLSVLKPAHKAYLEGPVEFDVKSNTTLDKITLELNSAVYECANCSQYKASLNLSKGNYTLLVTGLLGNVSKSRSVNFTVLNETQVPPKYNRTRFNQTGFGRGFEKLPQLFESGNLTDSELAQIIRDNKLNPGVINRLIKTGLLGNESIEAILDTQFKPTGILRKALALFGIGKETFAGMIYEQYRLSDWQEEKILSRDDLPKKYSEQLKEKMKARVKSKIQQGWQESDDDDSEDDDASQEKAKSENKSVKVLRQSKGDDDGKKGRGNGKDNNPGNGKGKSSGKGK